MHIEVKSTPGGAEAPFFVTRNELRVADALGDSYHLYHVFDLHCEARFYSAGGPLSPKFDLEPVQFTVRFRQQ